MAKKIGVFLLCLCVIAAVNSSSEASPLQFEVPYPPYYDPFEPYPWPYPPPDPYPHPDHLRAWAHSGYDMAYVDLGWLPIEDAGEYADEYVLERSEGSQGPSMWLSIPSRSHVFSDDPDVVPPFDYEFYTDWDVTQCVTYHYRIRAFREGYIPGTNIVCLTEIEDFKPIAVSIHVGYGVCMGTCGYQP